MNGITLDNIVVDKNRVDYFFSIQGDLQKYFNKNNHMFLEYNHDLSEIPNSILAIPFVSNVIPLIWITNSSLKVKDLDKSFFDCLTNVKAAYQMMFPNVPFHGSLIVSSINENKYIPTHEAASFFSGGLDAVTTFTRIKHKKPLLITEYGWHDDEIQMSEVWDSDKENVVSFAEKHGLENILIQSNYGTFIIASNIDYDFRKRLGDSWWHGLHHGLAIISAAIPIAYKLKIDCLYIASSNTPLFKTSCASDPTVDNEIRYASGKVFHDGFELTRQDKVRVVVDHYLVTKEPLSIRVCFKNKENCCNCEKCLRTILGIVAEGENPENFGFNIPYPFSTHLKLFLEREVKFLTDTFIAIYWKKTQERMIANKDKVIFKELLDWYLDYDFEAERKKALLKYRLTKFFPIIKRKIATKLNRIMMNSR